MWDPTPLCTLNRAIRVTMKVIEKVARVRNGVNLKLDKNNIW